MPPVRAVAKQLGASQKRLKPILDLVRGQRVDDALDTLRFLPSPWAKSVAKVVQSAAANAENNMLMDRDNLRIIHITADNAASLKRFRPGPGAALAASPSAAATLPWWWTKTRNSNFFSPPGRRLG